VYLHFENICIHAGDLLIIFRIGFIKQFKMPKNREALIRYRVINRLLVNRKYASLQEMAAACEDALDRAPISERTLRQDLFDMKNNRQLGYFAPIRYDYTERAYHYADKNYSIDRLPLTDEEIDALAFAGKMLEQFKSSEPFDQIEGAVDKILQHLRIRKETTAEEYRNFIDFEKAPVTGGSEYLGVLISAMKKKKALEVTYQSFEKDHPSTFVLHPYLLKEYRNRWYIFGYNEEYKEQRTYALDRIRKIGPAPMKKFIEPESPPREYFSKVIGITRTKDARTGEVMLKFSRRQANYILTQPLHESQEVIEETNDHVIISLDIEESPDLVRLLLGWGEEVEVLEPVSLRDEMRKIHEESAGKYQN
jgi:predicted DNA-binding transcriptional regulator YafY